MVATIAIRIAKKKCGTFATAGAIGGYLLGMLGVYHVFWASVIGGAAGVLAVIAVRSLHMKIRGT